MSNFKKIGKYFGFSLLLLWLIAMSFVWYNIPSEELKQKVEKEFYQSLSIKKAKRIIIYKGTMKTEIGQVPRYKIEIKNKEIISKIINAAKINNRRKDLTLYYDYYSILIDCGDYIYNFAYAKRPARSSSICSSYYNDCGIIHLREKAKEHLLILPSRSRIVSLENINLIPLIKKYVDDVIRNNPQKYNYCRKNENI